MPKGGVAQIPKITIEKTLSSARKAELLSILSDRFDKNMHRHPNIKWSELEAKLSEASTALASLNAMETTGGEPDVIDYDTATDEYIFYDCSKETPIGRRNVCYDRKGQEAREKQGIHPAGNVIDLVEEMGIELLSEESYRHLSAIETIDSATQSWVKTPSDIREKGGAIFADYRFGHVFIYHNTAQTFYSGRGFRGLLRV